MTSAIEIAGQKMMKILGRRSSRRLRKQLIQSGSGIPEKCLHLHLLASPAGVLLPGTSHQRNSADSACEKGCISLIVRACSHQSFAVRSIGLIGLGQGTRGSIIRLIKAMTPKLFKNHQRMHILDRCQTVRNGHGQATRHGTRQKRNETSTSIHKTTVMITGRGRCI